MEHFRNTISKNKLFGYRFWPDTIKGEGFFIAALKKLNSTSSGNSFKKKVLSRTTNKEAATALNFIENDDWFFFNHKENIKVVHSQWADDIGLFQNFCIYAKQELMWEES